MVKVSVIIPVYNAEKYLLKCVESILMQKNLDVEVLLINDGSTDKSASLCDDLAIKDKRLKVIHQNNEGVSSARNTGLLHATGEWTCFVDSDDWIEPNSLHVLINDGRNCHSDLVIARSFINQNEQLVTERYPFNKDWTEFFYNGVDLVIDKGYIRGSVCGVIFRNDFLRSHDILFPQGISNGEDSIFFSQCIIYAEKVTFANVHFYNIFERDGSASRSWPFDKILGLVNNVTYLNNYIKTHPELPIKALYILNYKIYGVISNIFNNFHSSFSIKNYILLRKELKKNLNTKIDVGCIKTNKRKIKIANFSLDLLALLIITKNQIKKYF